MGDGACDTTIATACAGRFQAKTAKTKPQKQYAAPLMLRSHDDGSCRKAAAAVQPRSVCRLRAGDLGEHRREHCWQAATERHTCHTRRDHDKTGQQCVLHRTDPAFVAQQCLHKSPHSFPDRSNNCHAAGVDAPAVYCVALASNTQPRPRQYQTMLPHDNSESARSARWTVLRNTIIGEQKRSPHVFDKFSGILQELKPAPAYLISPALPPSVAVDRESGEKRQYRR